MNSLQLNMKIDAARTLGQLCYAPAYEHILKMARNDRWELRAIVATALSSFGADENIDTLVDLICDREWWVRYRAAESLLHCSDTGEVVRRITARQDRFALEMMQFALDKQSLRSRKGAA
ncbi:MAG: HEAT repeat domain-containing protein [Eubacteriales bacterium]